jgi:hypothetical protein
MNRRQLLGLLAASPLAPVVAKQLKQQPLPENATQTVITNHMDFRGTLTADQIRDLVSRHAEQVKRDICDAFRRADGGPMPAASYYLVGEQSPEFILPRGLASKLPGTPP